MIQAKRAYVKEVFQRGNWPKYLLILIGMYLVWVLFKGVMEIRQAFLRIEEARKTLAGEQEKNQALKKKWQEVLTREYLERVARNDLNMQKEGETIVVLTENEPAFAKSYGEARGEKEAPNYLKWWRLIR